MTIPSSSSENERESCEIHEFYGAHEANEAHAHELAIREISKDSPRDENAVLVRIVDYEADITPSDGVDIVAYACYDENGYADMIAILSDKSYVESSFGRFSNVGGKLERTLKN